MAALTSDGLHEPLGVRYLIDEAHLTHDAGPDDYKWSQHLITNPDGSQTANELVVAGNHVVWTRHERILRVFDLAVERESIGHVFITTFASEPVSHKRTDTRSHDHALVVVLETQVQMYCLSGGTYTLPLPCEIGRAVPCAKGFLLQSRSMSKLSQASLSPTTIFSSKLAEPVSATPQRINSSPTYCFNELLSDYGVVVFSQNRKNLNFEQCAMLPGEEEIQYISSTDELPRAEITGGIHLAVTLNRRTARMTIWRVYYADKSTSLNLHNELDHLPKKKQATSTHNRADHRITSTSRRFPEPSRESFGGLIQSFVEPSTKLNVPQFSNIENLATELGRDFEPAGAQTRSAKRISSMIARSDLAGAKERSAFTDNNPASLSRKSLSKSLRKEGSIASFNGRDSFDGRKSLLATSVISNTTSFLSGYNRLSTTDVNALDNFVDELVSEEVQHMDNRMAFVKLKAFNVQPDTVQEDKLGIKVFVLVHPDSFRISSDNLGRLSICIFEATARTMTVVTIVLKVAAQSKTAAADHTAVELKAVETHTGASIHDACIVTDGDIHRLITVTKTSHGDDILHLEAPWSASYRIGLPLEYPSCASDALSMSQSTSAPTDQRGAHKGTKFDDVKHARFMTTTNPRQVSMQDLAGRIHDIQIQMQPQNLTIARILKLSSYVLSSPCKSSLLVAYWEAVRWLHEQELMHNTEWLALKIVLFAMAVPSIPALQQKGTSGYRKKAGADSTGNRVGGSNSDNTGLSRMLQQSNLHTCPAWSWMPPVALETHTPKSPSKHSRSQISSYHICSTSYVRDCIGLCRDFLQSPVGEAMIGPEGYLPTAINQDRDTRRTALASILIALYLLREEACLDNLGGGIASEDDIALLSAIAQISLWFGWPDWNPRSAAYFLVDRTRLNNLDLDDHEMSDANLPIQPFAPISIYKHIEARMSGQSSKFYTLRDLVYTERLDAVHPFVVQSANLLPHLHAIECIFAANLDADQNAIRNAIKSMPDIVRAICRHYLSAIEENPEPVIASHRATRANTSAGTRQCVSHTAIRDYRTVTHAVLESDNASRWDISSDTDKQNVTRILFGQDRRFVEASKLVNQSRVPEIEFEALPTWTEAELLEVQKLIAQYATVRTFSVAAGRAMMHYNLKMPLLTECVSMPRFSMQCLIRLKNGEDGQAMTFNVDKAHFTEDKSCWAFFHNGASAGLMVSRNAKWIDTSWILYNKPVELTNRHAGFLMALGLNGHLKNLAKWVAFKYLTPKHTMTSIGLLLGLAASHIGTADTLITRLLSVHVTCLLPPGAAELNLSPLTQTTGILGVGILYHNTQHRRMSEVMLSEIENQDSEDHNGDESVLRDEGYRLAAGISLGLINIGQGHRLHGLHDARVVERLLAVAIATKNVNLVHVLDRATSGAILATAFIYMKTDDVSIAQKIDVPDTIHQFEYVRADIFHLRTLARHLIMWSKIEASGDFVKTSLPPQYRHRHDLVNIKRLNTNDLPFFHIIAGICFAVALRYAGSHNVHARDLLVSYLDQFIRLCRLSAVNYDAKVTLSGLRNCLDILALSCATVMAGSGDLIVFRRLRALHGRADKETPFGSHLAAHMAIGALFLSGGMATFGTSNLAVAALVIAFYPLFPTDMLDNRGHLQALRHLWVLAIEHRCVVCRDLQTGQVISSLQTTLTTKDGTTRCLTTPGLMPELDTIKSITVNSEDYWPVNLDLDMPISYPTDSDTRPQDLRETYKSSTSTITISLRRRALYDRSNTDPFSTELQALQLTEDNPVFNQTVNSQRSSTGPAAPKHDPINWIFSLAPFSRLDHAERELILHPTDTDFLASTVIDEKLELSLGTLGLTSHDEAVPGEEQQQRVTSDAKKLWQMRLLLDWAERMTSELERKEEETEVKEAVPAGPMGLRQEFIEELGWRIWELSGGHT